jgi:hypothetical protein
VDQLKASETDLKNIVYQETDTREVLVDAKCALNANHTASRKKLASHAQRANDVLVNFS